MENPARITRTGNVRSSIDEINVHCVCYITNTFESATENEVCYLQSIGADVQQPKSSIEFLDQLRKNETNLIHISMKGDFERRRGQPVLQLQNGSSIVPRNLDDLGIRSQIRNYRPIVFLSAHDTNHPESTLVGIEKWGKKFAQAGCGAFLGFAWKFEKKLASEFAITFYRSAIDGLAIGQAIKHAQDKLTNDHDENAPAYYRFGPPNCRIRCCPLSLTTM